tara:strand:+ start:1353 stop:2546 length:1194 start_codon:yes stop_codon:yes gene_type:complete
MNIKPRIGFPLSKGIDYIAHLAMGSDNPFRKKQAVVGVGENGTGKTAIMSARLEELTGKKPVVFNCSFHGEEMVGLPNFNMEDRTSEMFINSNLLKIADDGKPHAIIIDELGKGSKQIKRYMSSLLHDRSIGGRRIPDDCIVVALTNYASEGLGDLFDPHELTRATFVDLWKDTVETFVENYGFSHFEPEICAWLLQNPKVSESFLDLDRMFKPSELTERREYNDLGIFDPKDPVGSGKQYVSYRTIESADTNLKLLKADFTLDDIRHGLIGSVGEKAAMSIITLVKLSGDLKSPADVEADPSNCSLPRDGAASSIMINKLRTNCVVTNAEGVVNPAATQARITKFVTYITRMKVEYQAQFVKGAIKDSRCKVAMGQNKAYRALNQATQYLNTADKL